MAPTTRMLAQKPKEYVLELVDLLKKRQVESVYLFGSHVKGSSSPLSDLDLLIIVPDKTTVQQMEQLHRDICRLEEQHGYRKSKTLEDKFLNFLGEKTGMFSCHFIWKKSDFIRGRMHKMHRMSPLVLLSPSQLVLSTIFSQMKLVTGKNLLNQIKPLRVGKVELLKSLWVTFVLALAQIPYSIVSRQATKYSLEAFKWSLYSCSVVDHLKEVKLQGLAEIYSQYFSKWYLRQVFSLRNRYKTSVPVIFATPWYVLKLHLMRLFGM